MNPTDDLDEYNYTSEILMNRFGLTDIQAWMVVINYLRRHNSKLTLINGNLVVYEPGSRLAKTRYQPDLYKSLDDPSCSPRDFHHMIKLAKQHEENGRTFTKGIYEQAVTRVNKQKTQMKITEVINNSENIQNHIDWLIEKVTQQDKKLDEMHKIIEKLSHTEKHV